MKLVTLRNKGRDGILNVLSDDCKRIASASDIAPTLQLLLEQWDALAPLLVQRHEDVNTARVHSDPFSTADALAPLPRAWQWLDASAFITHGELMAKVFGVDVPSLERPLMYQGLSHTFLAWNDDVVLPSEEDGIDFEGEFGVIVDAVPLGVSAEEAERHIKLVVQINDWSLRAIAPIEMKTGFGWVQAKPACSMAPIALTLDELGSAWSDGRVCLPLNVHWNDKSFGTPNGREMAFSFPELIVHAARTRALCAGTVIGSGTVSNADHKNAGYACIAERRALEILDGGAPHTPFMSFGDRVRMEAHGSKGEMLFGAIEQRITKSLGKTISERIA